METRMDNSVNNCVSQLANGETNQDLTGPTGLTTQTILPGQTGLTAQTIVPGQTGVTSQTILTGQIGHTTQTIETLSSLNSQTKYNRRLPVMDVDRSSSWNTPPSQQQQQQIPQQSQSQPQPPQSNQQSNAQPGQTVTAAAYSIPGIVHYLQYEWSRFEMQRQQWEVERAELQARIALLQGERKGQENLKNDLVRRIKMLEYCLRQERAKYHKLKFGVDLPNQGTQADELKELNSDVEESLMNEGGTQSGVNWKQGRQLLRQYLQEIGYTDTIIDVRSSRVRSLLGLNGNSSIDGQESSSDQDRLAKTNQSGWKSSQYNQENIKNKSSDMKSPRVIDKTQADSEDVNWKRNQYDVSQLAEASVLATFEFLNEQRECTGSEENGDDDEEYEDMNLDRDDQIDSASGHSGVRTTPCASGSLVMDSETEEVLAEFDFLSSHQADKVNYSQNSINMFKDYRRNRASPSMQELVDIGELAALTVANESLDLNGATAGSNITTEFRKTWNPKYILKSHFDCVRCLRFHATEPLLVTCSEDETLKLWNLNKTQQQSSKGKQQQQPTGPSGGTTFDLEPVYTFRGHTSRVLSLSLHCNTIYSGAQNGQLMIWSIPNNIANIDPYDPYDATLQSGKFEGHTDAIWSLVTITPSSNSSTLLCSASADKTIRIWDTVKQQCIKTITIEGSYRPTCLAAIAPYNNNSDANSANLLAASFTNGSICVYDIESSSTTPVLQFEQGAPGRINSIAVHPTMPVIVSAHEDRQIKLWDLNTGKCQNAMVAHLDEVTCLACDPNGLYVLSGSHDCSVRLWNFENRTCVQEITSHRKKFDEAIFDVTFHPSKPYFASAGADALAKVFV